MDFDIDYTCIELLHFLNCVRDQNDGLEIDSTILTYLDQRLKISVTDVRTALIIVFPRS